MTACLFIRLRAKIALATLAATNLFAAERISFDANWRFTKGDPAGVGTNLSYANIKAWILPTSNPLRTTNVFTRPDGEPAAEVAFTQPGFDDSGWRMLCRWATGRDCVHPG